MLVTLDLDVYKAVRRIIVPASLEFTGLHKVLQSAFNWRNYHLYDFVILESNECKIVARLVPFEEDLEYDKDAILMRGHSLNEFLPVHGSMIYTYDMGDNWKHEIRLVRVIEEYDKESPYLLEASGQTPPEDVGGVGGFVNFREAILNPGDPEHKVMKEWARFWAPEFSDRAKTPRDLRYFY